MRLFYIVPSMDTYRPVISLAIVAFALLLECIECTEIDSVQSRSNRTTACLPLRCLLLHLPGLRIALSFLSKLKTVCLPSLPEVKHTPTTRHSNFAQHGRPNFHYALCHRRASDGIAEKSLPEWWIHRECEYRVQSTFPSRY